MARYATRRIEAAHDDLVAHPAVQAWAELGPERVKPDCIEILKDQRNGRNKSGVYRLAGVGPRGSDVIAKRATDKTAALERLVYEDILSRLPISRPAFYGLLREGAGTFCWLFIEAVSGEKYSLRNDEHRELAARWLGVMHTTARGVAAGAGLPDRGPAHYLEHLWAGRETILQYMSNPALSSEDVALLRTIVSQYEVVASRWDEVERFCARVPRTLVHNDFKIKNVRVRFGSTGLELLPFDWEVAGWGVPATDLAQFSGNVLSPNLEVYASFVCPAWSHLDLHDIQQMAHVGLLFRCLAAIRWEACSLAGEWVERAIGNMHIYQAGLTELVELAGCRS